MALASVSLGREQVRCTTSIDIKNKKRGETLSFYLEHMNI
jgi:hypothetical protein